MRWAMKNVGRQLRQTVPQPGSMLRRLYGRSFFKARKNAHSLPTKSIKKKTGAGRHNAKKDMCKCSRLYMRNLSVKGNGITDWLIDTVPINK